MTETLKPGKYDPTDPAVQGLLPPGFKIQRRPTDSKVTLTRPSHQAAQAQHGGRVKPDKARRAHNRSKLKKLTSKKPGYVVALDRPGYGRASKRSVLRSMLG